MHVQNQVHMQTNKCKTHEILWAPKTALLGKSPLAVSLHAALARSSTTTRQVSYCQRRPNPVMHGPRGRIRSLPYLIVLACSIDRSTLLRFFVSEVPRIFIARGGGVTRSRPASAARPPMAMGGSNRHCSGTKLFYCIIYKVYFISKYASGPIFFLHLLSSNDFGAVHVIFYDLLVDSRVWA